MKYLFINSVAGFGSTGRIAAEQCRGLMAQGHECVIAYGRDKANCDDIPTVLIGSKLDYQLHGVMSRVLDNHGFGSKAATKRFLKWVREYDPDVIWLHNLHGYYIHLGELFSYLKTCGKTIYWTLHDCWSFTGHCSHFDFVGCDRWKTGCHDCPQKKEYPASLLMDNSRGNYAAKKALFTGIPNLTIIAPSYWLENFLKQSFLKEYPVEVVYNRIDPEVFKPTPGDFREKHGLQNQKIILGAASVWGERKGLGDFAKLSQMLDDSYRIVLIGLTAEQAAVMPKKILCLPRTDNMCQLAQAYTAADLFLNPSVEETFGMTAMEALSCGTHPIVYKGTACEEIVDRYGGTAVDRGAEHLYRAITRHFAQDRNAGTET